MVFRAALLYPIIERLAEERIRRGLMADMCSRVALIRNTCVAVWQAPCRQPLCVFSNKNYLPIGNKLRWRVSCCNIIHDGTTLILNRILVLVQNSSRANASL